MSTTTEIEIYTWQQFDEDIDILACRIREEKAGKYQAVYGIPRGGLPVAVALSHKLNLPLITTYPGNIETLVCDEITDSGGALDRFISHNFDTLTIFKHKNCPIKPTFWLRENDCWVHFPWEA